MTWTADQAIAARTEAAEQMMRVFPEARGMKPARPPEWVAEFVDRMILDAALCPHVRRGPRPMYAFVWERHWRCRPCLTAWTDEQQALREAGKARTLGPIEEFTCDFCRRYTGRTLSPVVIRLDLWIVNGAACEVCFGYLRTIEGSLVVGDVDR